MKTFVRIWMLLAILVSFTTCDTDNYWEEAYFDCVFEAQTAPQGYFFQSRDYTLRDIYFEYDDVYGEIQDIYLRKASIEIECLAPNAKTGNDYIEYIKVDVSGFGSFIFSDLNYNMQFGRKNIIILENPNFDKFMQDVMVYLFNNDYNAGRYTRIAIDASLVTYGAYYYPLKISLLNNLDVKVRDYY